MFPDWTWICGFIFGSAIGSFLNVVIYRMPLGMSLGEPKHSFCPNCKNQLRTIDLIPLLSWAFLGGKCRQCHQPVPARYFIVELITASLWGAIWYQQLCAGSDVVRACMFMLGSAALVAAIFIDLRWYIIPDQINAFLLLVGLAGTGAMVSQGRPEGTLWGMPAGVAGALVGWGVLWGITLLGRLLFQKDAMGHGDIKLARGMGAILMPIGVGLSIGMAVVLGAVIGSLTVLFRKNNSAAEEAEDDDEPYVPESIGSIFRCGLGYLLCIDVLGLFIPKLYRAWFQEDPFAVEEGEDDWQPSLTTIPFGPYLAAGAIAVMLAEKPLATLVQRYFDYVSGR